MGKQNLRAIVESIVIEALEEWMDECDLDEGDKKSSKKIDAAKAFGGAKKGKKDKVAPSKYNRDRKRNGSNNSD